MSRTTRDRPLPDLQPIRVDDSKSQRAFDALMDSLRAILKFLLPFAQPLAWVELPYYSTWGRLSATLQRPEYTRDGLDNVLVRGSVLAGTSPPTTIAVLPPGFRPVTTIDGLPASAFQGGTRQFVSVDVNSDGRIVYIAGPALAAGVEVHLNLRFSTRS